ncbi:MAG: hypothetical protein QW117_03060 [Candidatus Pacearchaeota archaeon]
MKNKKGQIGDWEEIIKFILVFPILLVLLGAILGVISQIGKQNCPACDCSQYQNTINNLSEQLEICNNQTVEVPVEKILEVEKPIYKDSPISITLVSISFILSIFLTIKLFKIKVKLPKEIEEKIKHYDKWIIRFKWLSLIVSILILLKLIIILWSLL